LEDRPTHAYPDKELKLWNRWVILDKDNNVVILLDKIGCATGSNVEIRFHPLVDFDVSDDHIILHGRRSQPDDRARRAAARGRRFAFLQLGGGPDLELLPLYDGKYTVIKGRQASVPVTESDELMWIPYVSTVLKAAATESYVGTVIYTTSDKSEGNPVSQFQLSTNSGKPEISCTLDGQYITYVFNEQNVERHVESPAK